MDFILDWWPFTIGIPVVLILVGLLLFLRSRRPED